MTIYDVWFKVNGSSAGDLWTYAGEVQSHSHEEAQLVILKDARFGALQLDDQKIEVRSYVSYDSKMNIYEQKTRWEKLPINELDTEINRTQLR